MDELRARLRELTHRAGLSNMPPGVLAASLAIAVVGIALGLRQWWPRNESVVMPAQPPAVAAAAPTEASDTAGAEHTGSTTTGEGADPEGEASPAPNGSLYVHVVGAIRRPGLYEVPQAARVAEVVAKAGGLLGNAAERGLNLARPVVDGEQIVVPTQDEFEADPTIASQTSAAAGSNGGGGGGGTNGIGGRGSALAPSRAARVNINTADVALLDTLPGVGPSTAQKILAEREANGPFSSVEDLGRVSGIGDKKIEGLRDFVVTK